MNHFSTSRQGGSVLLESLIAVLVFSLGILAIMGMQAASIRNTSDAKYRADASFLANEAIGMIWADRSHVSAYNGAPPTAWTTRLSNTLPAGTGSIEVTTDAYTGRQVVTVTVEWQQPGASSSEKHKAVAVAQINGAI